MNAESHSSKVILHQVGGVPTIHDEVGLEITLHEGEPVHQKLAITFIETDAAVSDD